MVRILIFIEVRVQIKFSYFFLTVTLETYEKAQEVLTSIIQGNKLLSKGNIDNSQSSQNSVKLPVVDIQIESSDTVNLENIDLENPQLSVAVSEQSIVVESEVQEIHKKISDLQKMSIKNNKLLKEKFDVLLKKSTTIDNKLNDVLLLMKNFKIALDSKVSAISLKDIVMLSDLSNKYGYEFPLKTVDEYNAFNLRLEHDQDLVNDLVSFLN